MNNGMYFKRSGSSDNLTAALWSAVQWNKMGDHPAVVLPTQEVRAGHLQTCGRSMAIGYLPQMSQVVEPGNFIVTDTRDGSMLVLNEHELRVRFGYDERATVKQEVT